jgi:predicted DsbA family dithiol-disulfide isomerase
MTSITITHYTDPGCPFAWSAEPARRRLQWLYGDQLEWRLRMAATLPACRAVVAVRRHAPEQEAAMLRALRVLHFSGELLDDPATLAAAAQRAGLDPADLENWLAEPETEALLAVDLAQARTPTPAALALSHKLAPSGGDGHRYTCPSYELVREQLGRVAGEQHIGSDGLWALEPVPA